MVTHETERGSVAVTSLADSAGGDENAGEEFCQLVTCRVDREEYAIDILSVQEINRMVEITRVPKAPSYVEGVINLRGRIIPVLDLRRRFGLANIERTEGARIVVVTVRGRVIGLIVDCVMEVLRIPKSRIEPPPAMGSTAGTEFTQGVGKINDRLLTLLDLERLLAPSDTTASAES
jgi:purine-binding chemotaxis protein CheW